MKTIKIISVLAIMLLAILGACVLNVSAATIITAEENDGDYSKAVAKGGSVTFDIVVTNLDTTAGHTVDMDYSEPSGFVVVTNVTNDQVTLVAKTANATHTWSAMVGFTATAKTATKAGVPGTIPIDFKIGSSVEDSITLTVTVNETYGVTMSTTDTSKELPKGTREGYHIHIKNTGNVDDTYLLTLTGIDRTHSWDAHIYSSPTSAVVTPSDSDLEDNAGSIGYNAVGLLTSGWVTGIDATSLTAPTTVIADAKVISQIAVSSGTTDDFWVYVDSPIAGANGSFDAITLRAESKNHATTTTTMTITTTIVSSVYGYSMTTSSSALDLDPDEIGAFTITLTSSSYQSQVVTVHTLTTANTAIWTIGLDDDVNHDDIDSQIGRQIDSLDVTLAANASVDIYVVVVAPSASDFTGTDTIAIVVTAEAILSDSKFLDFDSDASGGTGSVADAGDGIPGFEAIALIAALGVCIALLRRRTDH